MPFSKQLRLGLALWAVFSCSSGQGKPSLAQENAWKAIGQGSQLNAGRSADNEKAHLLALAEAEKFGPEDPRLAASLTDLAGFYHTRGRFSEAEPLYRRALAIWEKSQGPEHLNVGNGLNNLAQLYMAQGRYPEAEPLLQRALTHPAKEGGHRPSRRRCNSQ